MGPEGRLFSYEIREDFYRASQRTVQTYLGECPQWTIHLADALEGIQERNADRLTIDVPEPWKFLPVIKETLRPGGIALFFMANAIQIKSLHDGFLDVEGFARWETIETLLRPWHVKGMSVRPTHRMTAHTGFITVARRVADAKDAETERHEEGGTP